MLRVGQFYSPIAPLMAVTATVHFMLFARIFAYKFVHVYDRNTFQLGGQIAQKLLYLRWLTVYVSQTLFTATIIIHTCSNISATKLVQMLATLVVPVATIVLHIVIRRRTYPGLLRPAATHSETPVCGTPPPASSATSTSSEPSAYQSVRTSPGSRSSASLIAGHGDSATAAIPCCQVFAQWAGQQDPLAVDGAASPAPCEKDARRGSGEGPLPPDGQDHQAQAVWPAATTDPGYSLIWLPLLPAASSTCLVDIGAILAQADATRSIVPHPPGAREPGAREPMWVDARAFMDHLYEAIGRWLGPYGRVETAHAELGKRRVNTTSLKPPGSP
ncbi:hypothetical protein H4R21_000222 [Coemansia helicoidea]|uniref:Uncharacterized protein n=1 Tax=Coemansia helicoidea TaxID=1286919 RepID=A0ACC1LI71_9FUNG|nr:hypothetical protein H4R21_000222 [Coemansia helicoidea]